MAYETERWQFVQARDFLVPAARRSVRLIVLHTAENLEGGDSAESLGRYFQHPDTPSSSHIGVDNNSIVQYVKDSHVAYAAPGANHDGIQIEICGSARQTLDQWRDFFSLGTLGLVADAIAQYALKFNLPVLHLSDDQLRDGRPGIVGHDQVTRVYKKSDHTDPGLSFPWLRLTAWARASYEERRMELER